MFVFPLLELQNHHQATKATSTADENGKKLLAVYRLLVNLP